MAREIQKGSVSVSSRIAIMNIRREIIVETIQQLKDARLWLLGHQRDVEQEIKILNVALDKVERWLRVEDA